MDVNKDHVTSFAMPSAFCDWLAAHHDTRSELWLLIYKKASGVASVTWQEAVIEALAWGWIDGIKKSCDAKSYYQRFTPRRAKSNWSQTNCKHVETLIANGRMQPSGLIHVDAAKADGRWDAAYAGSKDMVIPKDFLDALAEHPDALAFYNKLSRANLFAIYHRLLTAKKPETRARRMQTIIEMLSKSETFH